MSTSAMLTQLASVVICIWSTVVPSIDRAPKPSNIVGQCSCLGSVRAKRVPCCRRPSRSAPAVWAPHRQSLSSTSILLPQKISTFRAEVDALPAVALRRHGPDRHRRCGSTLLMFTESPREARFLAAAGRRGVRPQFGRRSDNLRSSTSSILFSSSHSSHAAHNLSLVSNNARHAES